MYISSLAEGSIFQQKSLKLHTKGLVQTYHISVADGLEIMQFGTLQQPETPAGITALSHHLNCSRLIISGIHLRTISMQVLNWHLINLLNKSENYILEITNIIFKGQWV